MEDAMRMIAIAKPSRGRSPKNGVRLKKPKRGNSILHIRSPLGVTRMVILQNESRDLLENK
jgi:hypothetical protein